MKIEIKENEIQLRKTINICLELETTFKVHWETQKS